MFLFLRLVLGHFIGDFPLQTNEIFALKHRGLRGGIPHALIIVSCFLALSWPYLHLPQLWIFIAFLGLTHLFQDSYKITHEGLTKQSFWLYLLDQCSHIGLIAIIFFTELKNLTPPQLVNGFIAAYNNDLLILYLIAIIAATYNGFYLIVNFRLSFVPGTNQYTATEKWHGMFERAIIVTACLFPKTYLALIALFVIRMALALWNKKKKIAHHNFIEPCEILLSWIVALLAGMLLLRVL